VNLIKKTQVIKILPISDHESWSSQLVEYDHSMFITPFWIESLKDKDKQPLYLDFLLGEEVIAKIGGFSVSSKYAFQRKLLFYAAPAIKKSLPESIIDQCITALVQYTKAEKICRLILLSYDSRHISNLQERYGFSKRSEYIIDLTQDKEKIKNNISRNVKREYKNAISHGFVFKETVSVDMTGHLINLMKETQRIRISKGYGNYNYFYINGLNQEAFVNLVRKNVIHFYCVERDSEVFAVQAVLQANHQAYALLIGMNAAGYEHGLSSFIDYSLIQFLKENNYSYVNFGGVPIDKSHKGIADFKRRLGAMQHFSSYGSTHFLIFPYNLVNPLVRLLRRAPENPVVTYLKKTVNH
jgi:hypothetical protein